MKTDMNPEMDKNLKIFEKLMEIIFELTDIFERKEKLVKKTYMATDVAGEVQGVDPTAKMFHDVAIVVSVDGLHGPDFTVAPVPVVGMSLERRDGHLEGGISLNLGIRGQMNLKLASTASDGHTRKATSQMNVGHGPDQSAHHFKGVGLQAVVGGDALSRHSSEVVGGDLADQDTGVTVSNQQLLVTLTGQHVAPQLAEGRVHEEGVVSGKAEGLQDVAHV